MKKFHISLIALTLPAMALAAIPDKFPDGSPMPEWFTQTSATGPAASLPRFVITDHGVAADSTLVQTRAIQAVIDMAAEAGGGVVVVPEGTFLSGSLFFKPGTHLRVEAGGKLKGSDAITHYKIVKTRLEGQTIDYFAALVNADSCHGFTISGEGTIDGNGHRFYDEFWLRRKVNPKCTNLEALRPRMVYISNSDDVSVSGVHMVNSGFWTNHLYNCRRVKYQDVTILAPTDGYPKGPSTDAIDLDVCSDVLVSRCHMNVNDDAVCLKGGKGTWVDTIPGNGGVHRVVIDQCSFGKTNAGVTFGSEAWDCSNVVLTDCEFDGTAHVLLFKMRPDTPQQYRHVLVDGVSGRVKNGLEVQRWTQFYNKTNRDPMPPSAVADVDFRRARLSCIRDFYKDAAADYYTLSRFSFSDIEAEDPSGVFDTSHIDGCTAERVVLKAPESETDSDTFIDMAN